MVQYVPLEDNMKKERKKESSRKKRRVAAVSLTLLATLLWASFLWLENYFADLTIDKMVFQMKVPMEGTGFGIIFNYLLYVIPPCLIMGGLLFLLLKNKKGSTEKPREDQIKLEQEEEKQQEEKRTLPLKHQKKWILDLREKLKKHLLLLSSLFLLSAVVFGLVRYDIPNYLYAQTHPSNLYETCYVHPDNVEISFPEKKRNLIYIFLESFENTYASKEYGGYEEENLLPELTALQREKESVYFSQTGGYGMIEMANCSWTMASMVAQTSGVPLSIPLANNGYNMYKTFLPGLTTIGEILEEQGYHQVLLIGSEAAFAGTDHYFEQHGNYEIHDYNYALEQGWIPEDYYEWWGYEDQKLFQFAKEELTRLAGQDEPFNLTMATMDTHCVSGYQCELCGDKYEDPYHNVIACADRQLAEFVEWIKKQPWYDNTTVVLCGDHLTMDTQYSESVDKEFPRSIFQVIVNPAVEAQKAEDRLFCALDFFPTTLAALGAEIPGDRLGLGTNLFSEKTTLCESMGTEELGKKIKQTSRYYNRHFLFEKKKSLSGL